ncbi:hypothetical protein PTSG_11327 [Salpingoeca rosetta]|uniref:Uncharacterized protein n=1 Tax=Salpingoeca rosetta (strain ATCC 50818 / BSB-021) TaxID=946362 RepID=F2UT31_SALR5|nr:uncharacterized protein PTSG_11327 [Salpingoeca rosetta]EGD81290.1 hypothetical protein PTSG_11327 [Salpingoeca rosetta]|eukprot:XP_004987686.1 hypothetical protein PTSG_11327 [Salpingoeca rosetta]
MDDDVGMSWWSPGKHDGVLFGPTSPRFITPEKLAHNLQSSTPFHEAVNPSSSSAATASHAATTSTAAAHYDMSMSAAELSYLSTTSTDARHVWQSANSEILHLLATPLPGSIDLSTPRRASLLPASHLLDLNSPRPLDEFQTMPPAALPSTATTSTPAGPAAHGSRTRARELTFGKPETSHAEDSSLFLPLDVTSLDQEDHGGTSTGDNGRNNNIVISVKSSDNNTTSISNNTISISNNNNINNNSNNNNNNDGGGDLYQADQQNLRSPRQSVLDAFDEALAESMQDDDDRALERLLRRLDRQSEVGDLDEDSDDAGTRG